MISNFRLYGLLSLKCLLKILHIAIFKSTLRVDSIYYYFLVVRKCHIRKEGSLKALVGRMSIRAIKTGDYCSEPQLCALIYSIWYYKENLITMLDKHNVH